MSVDIILIFEKLVSQYGYFTAFVISLLENSIFLGLIMPGDTIILLSGFYVGKEALSFPLILAVLVIGASIGDNIGFLLGRKFGREWIYKYGPKLGYNQSKIKKSEMFWKRHGSKAIIIGDYMSYLRTFVPFFAGTSGMKQKYFFVWDLMAVFSHAVLLLALGYFFGNQIKTINSFIGTIGILILFVFLLFLYRFVKAKNRKKNEN